MAVNFTMPLFYAKLLKLQTTESRPAKSSDKAEDLPLLWIFLNLPPFRFILKFFSFFRTLLVIANNIHRHIEVLLFSSSFIISVLCGHLKTEKYAHSVSPADRP